MRKFILTAVIALGFATATQGQCDPTNQKPTAGVEYTYEVAITGATSATDKVYNWYITQDTNLLTGSILADDSDFKVGATGSTYNSTATDGTTKNNLKLKWKPDAIAKNGVYYLVLKYSEHNGTCTVNNLKVLEIKPLNRFTLDIAPVIVDEANGGFKDGDKVCVADVSGAIVTAGSANQGTTNTDTKVKYTYGENKLYYKVTAKGLDGQWLPEIKLPALQTGQKYVSAKWSADNGTTWKTFPNIVQDATEQTLTSATTDKAPVTVAGSDIIYEVTINNNTYETLTDQTVAVATDGTIPSETAGVQVLKDQKKDACENEVQWTETTTNVTIKARPTVTPATGNIFIPVN